MDLSDAEAMALPSPQHLQAAQLIAERLGVDTCMVARRHVMERLGVRFWLQHYGSADPTGIVLVIQADSLIEIDAEGTCRRLLASNFHVPVGPCGYFALLPGTDLAVYCCRIDLERNPDADRAVLELLDAWTRRQELAQSLRAALISGSRGAGRAMQPTLAG